MSLEETLELAAEACMSATPLVGLNGVSVLPSRLTVSSRPDRTCNPGVRSDTARLSRLVLPERPIDVDASDGLLTLRLPVERPIDSSLLTPLLDVSRSLNAVTVTGATDGVAAVGVAAFAILGMLCPLAEFDFEVVIVVADDLDGRTWD